MSFTWTRGSGEQVMSANANLSRPRTSSRRRGEPFVSKEEQVSRTSNLVPTPVTAFVQVIWATV